MKYVFVDESWEDYLYWQKTDKKMLQKINSLLKDISRTPFEGIGKPEALKHKYRGFCRFDTKRYRYKALIKWMKYQKYFINTIFY